MNTKGVEDGISDEQDFEHEDDCPCFGDNVPHSIDCANCTCDKSCKLPPDGWICSRGFGHEGPCAARPRKLYQQPEQPAGGSPQAHEWMGCEEVNDWFVASCSCGWTYQHPNYGTSQDTFVNHWGDHILATRSKLPKPAEDGIEAKPESPEELPPIVPQLELSIPKATTATLMIIKAATDLELKNRGLLSPSAAVPVEERTRVQRSQSSPCEHGMHPEDCGECHSYSDPADNVQDSINLNEPHDFCEIYRGCVICKCGKARNFSIHADPEPVPEERTAEMEQPE